MVDLILKSVKLQIFFVIKAHCIIQLKIQRSSLELWNRLIEHDMEESIIP